jgi:hypothetical protein
MATAPLLNLDTLTERPMVGIDGTAYELLMPESMPVTEFLRLNRLRARFSAAWSVTDTDKDIPPETAREVEDTLEQLVSMVLKAPVDVLARLNDAQRLTIYRTFLTLPRLMQTASAGPKAAPTKTRQTAKKPRTGTK